MKDYQTRGIFFLNVTTFLSLYCSCEENSICLCFGQDQIRTFLEVKLINTEVFVKVLSFKLQGKGEQRNEHRDQRESSTG